MYSCDTVSGQLLATLSGHYGEVRSVAFDPAGTALVSGGADGSVKIWEAKSSAKQPLRTLVLPTTRRFTDVVLADDGKTVALGVEDGTIQLWDFETRHKRATIYGYSGAIRSLAFSHDCKLLASESWDTSVQSSSSDSAVRVWDVATGRELEPPNAAEMSFARRWSGRPVFNDDDSLLASAAYEEKQEYRVVLRDRQTGAHIGGPTLGPPIISSGYWTDESALGTCDHHEAGRVDVRPGQGIASRCGASEHGTAESRGGRGRG